MLTNWARVIVALMLSVVRGVAPSSPWLLHLQSSTALAWLVRRGSKATCPTVDPATWQGSVRAQFCSLRVVHRLHMLPRMFPRSFSRRGYSISPECCRLCLSSWFRCCAPRIISLPRSERRAAGRVVCSFGCRSTVLWEEHAVFWESSFCARWGLYRTVEIVSCSRCCSPCSCRAVTPQICWTPMSLPTPCNA